MGWHGYMQLPPSPTKRCKLYIKNVVVTLFVLNLLLCYIKNFCRLTTTFPVHFPSALSISDVPNAISICSVVCPPLVCACLLWL